ncbi:globin family protein [Shimia sp. Alg240-R146]|uniref:globin family protein n=1 Tax=Shimia sp. Alg240-R146 TaxID=2993449 RepID=UPI0022E08CE4|nr:globin family protein [Shimia sp. Alg240-R146]
MNDTQITLVQQSFEKVAPIAPQAAEIFYARLFEIAPEVTPLFQSDIAEQGAKLMATLGAVVKGLRDLDRIVPVAQNLAVAHLGYGVTADHYEPVGAALLHTLKTGLGNDFDAETEAAWETAYTTLSGVMKDAAYGGSPGQT